MNIIIKKVPELKIGDVIVFTPENQHRLSCTVETSVIKSIEIEEVPLDHLKLSAFSGRNIPPGIVKLYVVNGMKLQAHELVMVAE